MAEIEIDNADGFAMHGIRISNSSGTVFRGVSFIGRLPADAEPLHSGNGNVSWPVGWSEERRANWRRDHNLPGAEWEPSR